jgi:predicted Zn-dependent protease
MSATRIASFELMASQQPENAMVWYGLANEYSKIDRWQDAATALEKVIELNPDYTSAWQMLGSAYSSLNEKEKARDIWTKGLETADRTGAWKAREHIRRLLDGLESADQFCREE